MKKLFVAIIVDFLSFFKKEKDFFKLDASSRRKLLEEARVFPANLLEYFSTCTEEQFFEDWISLFFDENNRIKFEGGGAEELQEYLATTDSGSIRSLAQGYLQKYFSGTTIIVESPVEIESDLKAEITAHFGKKYPFSFTIFRLNKGLLGGLRIFVHGSTYDFSWISKVKKLFASAAPQA